MRNLIHLCIVLAAFIFNNCSFTPNASAKPSLQKKTGISVDSILVGNHKLYIYPLPQNCKPQLTQQRPSATDNSILLCAAAAFTRLDNGQVDGLFVVNGRVSGAVSKRLGGGCLLNDNSSEVKLFGTRDGNLLTKKWIDSNLTHEGVSFFQQLQLVRDYKVLRYGRDSSYFQRRAIVDYENKNQAPAIIESASVLTMQQFADALAAINIRNALYLDMGAWDEGWIRTTNGKRKTIGLIRSQTSRQCNWIVFKQEQ